MGGFLAGLTATERLFAACAMVGGALFVLQTIMHLFVGFDSDGGMASDDGGAFDLGEADASFRALSLQGITAFFMMFGLVGMALARQSFVGDIFAIVGGVLAGILTVWVIGRVFAGMQKLQSDGTLRYENAIGQHGTVYLTIPAHGRGQVSVPIQQQLRVCEAVSADHTPLPTGERVLVVDVQGNVLVVTKAS